MQSVYYLMGSEQPGAASHNARGRLNLFNGSASKDHIEEIATCYRLKVGLLGDAMFDWREDPKLKGRFHQEAPDDLQVIVHEGGPRLTDRSPELIWVRATGNQGLAYVATLLSQPHNLVTLKEGDDILFVAHESCEYPFRVTEKYLLERHQWRIEPCNKCGFAELFDAPSDLIRKIFPDLPDGSFLEGFTSFCPICGGVQTIMDNGVKYTSVGVKKRKWWRFW